MGYYMLCAIGEAGDLEAALNIIREYWGAMLSRGATTFWEDFNMEWLEGSSRIDELVAEGEKDLHGDYGCILLQGIPAQPLPRLGFRTGGLFVAICAGRQTGCARL